MSAPCLCLSCVIITSNQMSTSFSESQHSSSESQSSKTLLTIWMNTFTKKRNSTNSLFNSNSDEVLACGPYCAKKRGVLYKNNILCQSLNSFGYFTHEISSFVLSEWKWAELGWRKVGVMYSHAPVRVWQHLIQSLFC